MKLYKVFLTTILLLFSFPTSVHASGFTVSNFTSSSNFPLQPPFYNFEPVTFSFDYTGVDLSYLGNYPNDLLFSYPFDCSQVCFGTASDPNFVCSSSHCEGSIVDGSYDGPFSCTVPGIYIRTRSGDHVSQLIDPAVISPGQCANQAPTVDAGGPYQVNEGGSVQVTATGNDPENGPLIYTWDLDNNDSFETPSQTVTFSAAGLDAPSSRTIIVKVTDSGGLTATDQATVNVIYNFAGFFQPVDNLPVLNKVNGTGKNIKVKFSLTGNQGLNIFAAGYPTSRVITCDTVAPVDDIEEVTATGPSGLQYDPSADQYMYSWSTSKSWSGTCRQLTVRLNDGTDHKVNFQFK